MENLSPAKKAQLDEVATLMLEIYRTLVRMRYLDDEWIQEGPHDIEALIPMYRSYNLDNSIIYLYRILPYVDTGGAEYLDFFQGGRFADFRLEEDVERGRDPFHEDGTLLPPYMTPLSLLGNHQGVIFYNARRHWISICDHESGGSTDHTRWLSVEAPDEVRDEGADVGGDGGRHEGTDAGSGGEETNEDEEGSEGDETDEDYDEDEDDESSDGEGGNWDEMDSRSAGDVLRDIIRWFHELTETPGRGDLSCVEWDPDVVRPVYRKHGWPGSDFDGDAFRVDLARANAHSKAQGHIAHFGHEVEWKKAWLIENEPNGSNYIRMKEAKEEANTVEELWVARWHLWNLGLKVRRDSEEIRRLEKEGDDAKRRGLVLGEVENLAQQLQYKRDYLKDAQHKFRDIEGREREKTRDVQLRLRYAKEQVEIFQRAYEASRADAEVIFPGKFDIPSPMGHRISEYEARLQLVTRYVEDARREAEEIRGWIAQLPEGASQARTLAHDTIDEKERVMEAYL